MGTAGPHRGWLVAGAGTGINLALGVLYAWSIFKLAIKFSVESGGDFAWGPAQLNDPYSTACLVFALSMIGAGRLQDRWGPRLTALLGAVLVGAGMLLIAHTTDHGLWVLGFGVLVGMGIGCAYAAATPPALKWFPPARTGLVAGVVVSGFGLAAVYIAPLARHLIDRHGLAHALLALGLSLAGAIAALSLLLVNPPAGASAGGAARTAAARGAGPGGDVAPARLLRTGSFYLLWLLFFIGAGAGLMVIGSIGEMARAALGEAAFVAVAVMAVGNAAGRIAVGAASDRLGRRRALGLLFAAQAALMLAGAALIESARAGAAGLLLLATLIGFNYGGNLSLFPSLAKDRYGLKHFGVNYGLLFTAWGAGGFVMSRWSQMLYAGSGSYRSAFLIAAGLLAAGGLLTLALRGRRALPSRPVERMFAGRRGVDGGGA